MGLESDMVKMLDGIDLDDGRSSRTSDCVRNARLEARQRKMKKIRDLLAETDQPNFNIMYFRRFATTSGGLLDHEFRLAIWPILAEHIPEAFTAPPKTRFSSFTDLPSDSSCSDSDFFESARSSFSSTASINGDVEDDDSCGVDCPATPSMEDLHGHVEWNQVELDVNRTLARFPPDISETERFSLQADLSPIIVELLCRDKSFRYYQGFHDVVLTLLLVLNVEKTKRVVRHLVERSAFRNYLTKSLEESALTELHLIYVILHHCAPQIEKILREAELGTLFALSWPITWFSHALQSLEQVVLCFDMFLSSHHLMPIYVSAALVEHRRNAILSCEHEMPSLHHLLNNVPSDLDMQIVLDRARDLFQLYPPGLVQGVYLDDYNELCAQELRHARPPHLPVRRQSALSAPWVVVGTAAAGVAAYWWLTKYTNDMMGLL